MVTILGKVCRGLLASLSVFLALPAMVSGGESQLAIDHKAVGCIVAEKFPRFEAGVNPSGDVGRIRLRFRPEGFEDWYSVTMKPEGAVFAGALPKPKKSLKALDYYIEATDRDFGTSRTQEYRASVVSGPAACEQGKVVAGSLGSASVVIEVPAGAPPVPAGFASTGVATAGTAAAGAAAGAAGAGAAVGGAAVAGAAAGGIGTTTLLVVGGVVVAGAGTAVAVAATSGDSTPPTTLPPSLTGRWSGTLFENDAYGGCTANWSLTMNLVETAGSLTGDMTLNGISSTTGIYTCAGGTGEALAFTLSGGNATSTTVQMPFTNSQRPQAYTFALAGSVGAGRTSMTGTWSMVDFALETGTWTANKQP